MGRNHHIAAGWRDRRGEARSTKTPRVADAGRTTEQVIAHQNSNKANEATAKVIVAALVMIPAVLPPASASWCAQYSGGGGGENCGFSTFEQCQATVSGIGGFCRYNPGYASVGRANKKRRY
jgi:Protein of unknown function (DUF3551)